MPDLDGLALTKAIKSDPAIASTRLVLMTPRGRAATRQSYGRRIRDSWSSRSAINRWWIA